MSVREQEREREDIQTHSFSHEITCHSETNHSVHENANGSS